MRGWRQVVLFPLQLDANRKVCQTPSFTKMVLPGCGLESLLSSRKLAVPAPWEGPEIDPVFLVVFNPKTRKFSLFFKSLPFPFWTEIHTITQANNSLYSPGVPPTGNKKGGYWGWTPHKKGKGEMGRKTFKGMAEESRGKNDCFANLHKNFKKGSNVVGRMWVFLNNNFIKFMEM